MSRLPQQVKKNVVPPDDMCIKHVEWRENTHPCTDAPNRKYGNVYYHFDPHCIWLKHDTFIPSGLQIPDINHVSIGRHSQDQAPGCIQYNYTRL